MHSYLFIMKLKLLHLLGLIGVPFALSIQNWMQIAPLLIQQPVTWPVAQNYCRENHLDLFTIKTPSNQVKLIGEMNKHNVIGPVWVGLYSDLDSWYWSYNHIPLKNTTLRKWYTGFPNNGYPHLCGIIYNDASWENSYCYNRFSFICYDATRSPDKFVGYSQPLLTWFDAQAYCQQYHTDLASSINETDNTNLQQIVKNLQRSFAWIGLTRDHWKWSDGTEPLSLPWSSLQPDNYYTWENCGAAQNGLLGDEKCTNQYYFACSAYLFRTQIVKLQVQSDMSVFDPAVQSSILELIKQKLQENGMFENTTATWKVQPDGNIFYKTVKNKQLP